MAFLSSVLSPVIAASSSLPPVALIGAAIVPGEITDVPLGC